MNAALVGAKMVKFSSAAKAEARFASVNAATKVVKPASFAAATKPGSATTGGGSSSSPQLAMNIIALNKTDIFNKSASRLKINSLFMFLIYLVSNINFGSINYY